MDKFERIALETIEHVGGTANIVNAYHCMTRLRLNLKDKAAADLDAIRAVEGVMGVQESSGELQVIIGPKVEDAYNHLIAATGLTAEEGVEENLDPDLTGRTPFTWRTIPNKILEAFSATMAPLIPLFVVVGVANVIAAVIGPAMLNLVSAESAIYTNFYFIGQSILYFLPVLTAYTASRYFHTSALVSISLAALMVYPSLVAALAGEGGYSIYGIPAPNVDYSAQLIPTLLVVWIQSYVERGLKKVTPEAIDVLIVPFGTMAVMLPLAFCLLGPLGFYIGSGLAQLLAWLYAAAGPVESMVVCALMPFLTIFGIGKPIFFAALTSFMTTGVEYSFLPAAMAFNNFLVMGICTGYIIKTRSAKKREYGVTSLVANALGGVSEPTLFGIILPNRRTYLPIFIGGAAGGLYAGITNVAYYQFGASNVLSVLGFMGGEGSANLVNGCIASAICFAAALVAMLVLYREDEPVKAPTAE